MAQQLVDEQLVLKGLEKFDQHFVLCFEKYQLEYTQVLTNQIKQNPGKNKVLFEKVGRVGKAGTAAAALDPIIKAAVLASIETAVVLADFVEGKYNKVQLKNIAPRLFEYERDPEKGRQILVEGASQVFLCFEAQFMNIGKAGVWEMAIVRVAKDAARRVIDFLTKNRDKVLSSATIFEGVIHGKTKTYDGSMSVFENGHKVELDGKNVRTDDLFTKLGLKCIDKFGTKFMSRTNTEYPQNGFFFRLLSEGEKNEAIHLKKLAEREYKSVQVSKDEEYTYRLTQEYIRAKHEFILSQIKSNQSGDDFKEIQALATENAQSIIKLLEDKHDEIMTFLDENKEFLEKMQLMFKGNFERLEDSGERILESVGEVLENSQEHLRLTKDIRDHCFNQSKQSSENHEELLNSIGQLRSAHDRGINADTEPMRFSVKRPVGQFTGREGFLNSLNERINKKVDKPTIQTQITVVSGLGGVGKTQSALRFIEKYCQRMDVLWMGGESELSSSFITLAKDYCKLATIDADGNGLELSTVVQKVYQFFAKKEREVLIVFDNVQKQIELSNLNSINTTCRKMVDLTDFLPGFEELSKIHILITSRYEDWDPNVQFLPLREFTPDEAKDFVRRRLGLEDTSSDDVIEKFVKRLQYFPLALEQAVAYICREKRKRYTTETYTTVINSYLEGYNDVDKSRKLLDDGTFRKRLDHEYRQTIYTTWNLTVNKIKNEEHGDLAVRLLNGMSLISPENIYAEMFFSEQSEKNEVQLAVDLLVAYSLVSAEQDQEVLSIHRLVQEVMRLKMYEQMQCADTVIIRTTRQMELFFKESVSKGNYDYMYTRLQMVLPHLEVLLVYLNDWRRKRGNSVMLQDEQVVPYDEVGRTLTLLHVGYQLTENPRKWKDILEKAKEICESVEGRASCNSARVHDNLVQAYGNLGMLTESYDAAKHALKILKLVSGMEMKVGELRYSLSVKCANLGKFEESIHHARKALEIFKEQLKEDEFALALWRIHITDNYFKRNRCQEEANRISGQSVLVIEKYPEKLRKLDDPVILMKIGEAYVRCNKMDQGTKYFKKSLIVNEEKYGRDSEPHVHLLLALVAYSQLSLLEKNMFVLDEYMPVLEENQKYLFVAQVWEARAELYKEKEDLDKCIESYEKALSIYREIRNPDVEGIQREWISRGKKKYPYMEGCAWIELGKANHAKGNHQMAEEQLKTGLSILESLNGHLDTGLLPGLLCLAMVFKDQKNFLQSRDVCFRVLCINKKHYGEGHKMVAEAQISLGSAYRYLGDKKQMRKWYRKAKPYLDEVNLCKMVDCPKGREEEGGDCWKCLFDAC